jgi:hypothetical protein
MEQFNLSSVAQRIIKQLTEKVERDYYDSVSEAANEIGYVIDAKLNEIVDMAVDNFYSAYRPMYYVRKYDLKNVLTSMVNQGNIIFEADWDASKMTTYREPTGSLDDGLFQHTFVEGWHGGALDKETGRTRYRNKASRYAIWSYDAFRSKSPYDMIIEEWNIYRRGALGLEFRELLNEHMRARGYEL